MGKYSISPYTLDNGIKQTFQMQYIKECSIVNIFLP